MPNDVAHGIGRFLACHDDLPYAFQGAIVSRPAVDRWWIDRIRSWIGSEHTRLIGFEENGKLAAAAAWSRLPWDSKHFGFGAARIQSLGILGTPEEVTRRGVVLLDSLLESCRAEAVRHVIARISSANLAHMHLLEEAGFRLVEGIQTFVANPQLSGPLDTSAVEITPFEPKHLDGLLRLGAAFRFDRFHSDPALTEAIADEIHRDWIRNSCVGAAADKVFVATHQLQVVGFITLRLDKEMIDAGGPRLATIVLIATAEGHRGRGIGRAMVMRAVNECRQLGVVSLQVGTQVHNISAVRLYTSCGFQLAEKSMTFRHLLQ